MHAHTYMYVCNFGPCSETLGTAPDSAGLAFANVPYFLFLVFPVYLQRATCNLSLCASVSVLARTFQSSLFTHTFMYLFITTISVSV
jgi:hypothetical protein